MGKEWLYWVVGGGGGGGGNSKSTAKKGRRIIAKEMKEATATSAGCMCAVFQLFDLHHFQYPLNHQHQTSSFSPDFQEEPTSSKGVEAPRNSLEMDESTKEENNLTFPVGIHIKTGHEKISLSSPRVSDSKSRIDDISSPGTKTPTLVARLMGLDLLPECTSPSLSTSSKSKLPKSKKSHFHKRNISQNKSSFYDDDINIGARSLPETPRVSSSSSRRSDVEYNHRLSLQLNKENLNDEFSERNRRRRFRQQAVQDAKQIVKQVKENVSRRVGLSDMTNSKNREKLQRRDENLIVLKSKNSNFGGDIRFLETNKNKSVIATTSGTKSPSILVPFSDNLSNSKSHENIVPSDGKKMKCKKLLQSQVIRNKKEELFVHSKATKKGNFLDKKSSSKKTPLSSEILNISGPTLLPIKKDPSLHATKLPQKQSQVSDALSSKRFTQLSSNPSHSYKLITDNTNGCATTVHGGAAAEYKNYIQKILKRTDPLNLSKWHTPSHPLDPSIFHYVELFHPITAVVGGGATVLSRRCNRKLIFQLVDELLAEISRRVSMKNQNIDLVDELCEKILCFPAANCEVLEDIDALVDTDFSKSMENGFLEEERERIVCEIEGEIVESLVRETVAEVGSVRRRRNRDCF